MSDMSQVSDGSAVEYTDLPPYDGHTPAKAAERLRRYCATHIQQGADDGCAVP